MSQSAIEHYQSEFEQLPVTEHDWLRDTREEAIASFNSIGFPTLKHEHWKYTDIRPVTRRNFTNAGQSSNSISKTQLASARFQDLDCLELVFINGNFSPALSKTGMLPDGVIIDSLSSVISAAPEIVKKHLGQYADKHKNAFVSLNTAFITEGACIYVPDNTEIDRPINILFLNNQQEKSFFAHPRNLIVLGKNSRATVIESYIGFDDAEYFTNTICEVVTEDGASLEHYKVQQESVKSYHIGNTVFHQHRDSRVESHSISLGGALTRNDIDSDLADQGAQIILNGLYMASGKQHVDNHTLVNHSKPNTSSDEVYRGVLNDHSRGVFNGKVIVHEHAQKTDAHQSNANLLLSDNAEVDTKPELEIYADDVKCSHGATVGQLDENMLFYLRARAIDEDTARALLTFAFADEVIKRIKFAPVRERLEYLVVGRLPDATLIKEFM